MVGKPGGKTPLPNPGHMWEAGIILKCVVNKGDGMEWIRVDQGKLNWGSLLNILVQLILL